MKVLVIGGNHFFGIDIVNELIKKGFEVHIMNRGNKSPKYLDQVTTHICDRENRHEFERVAKNNFDLVFDQFCMNEGHALQSVRVFQGKCGKYVMCSSQSVYGEGGNLKEADFSAENYTFSDELMKNNPYAENKRRAETVINKSKLKNLIIRPPIVMGETDVTRRLSWHVKKIVEGVPLYFPDFEAKISFVNHIDLANCIVSLGTGEAEGAFNVSSEKPIELGKLISIIESKVSKKIVLDHDGEHSPYGNTANWWMNIEKLKSSGCNTRELREWLPDLIDFEVTSICKDNITYSGF